MYLSVSHSLARLHSLHFKSSRWMWSAACLLRLSLGSLLVNSDSGLGWPTTGSASGLSCAAAGVAAKAAPASSAAANGVNLVIGTSPPWIGDSSRAGRASALAVLLSMLCIARQGVRERRNGGFDPRIVHGAAGGGDTG